MSYTQNPPVVNANVNIHVPEDDIDAIFSQLQQIEPPQQLIARIIAQIPQQTSQVSTECFFLPILRESEMNFWTIHTRQKNLC
ncbi:MAG TPA: hypothetical protein VKU38_12800 [Ktedonobacteraceae bacterium]|nr:hypothetical protein [Ktedonobacteraceae bacterium]